MSKVKLRKRDIDALPIPKDKPVIYWDTVKPRFGLRITPAGVRTFVLDYTTKNGRQRRMTLGRFGEITAEQAREMAGDRLAEIRKGSDPLAEHEAARGAATFKTLAEEYIRYRCAEKKSGPEDARIIRRELLPHWGRKLAADIRRRDVMNLADEIKERGAGIMANRTLSVIRRLYNFGIDRELVEINPASRVKPPAKEKTRDRVLDNEEIKTLWSKIEKLPGDPATRLALRLILVTAQRPGEVASLAWEDIDTEGVWTIPAEKSKNGLAHRVPFSPFALELLHALPHGNKGPVFPSPADPRRPITRAALARLLNRGRKVLKMERFSPHDLRRTAASKMAAMGVSRFVLSRVLNHVDTGITAVYDRHGYDGEKRTALETWAMKLRDIVEGRETKVLPLAR